MAHVTHGFSVQLQLIDCFYLPALGIVSLWHFRMLTVNNLGVIVQRSAPWIGHVAYPLHDPDAIEACIQKLREEWLDNGDNEGNCNDVCATS
jgi:hypothetical protein